MQMRILPFINHSISQVAMRDQPFKRFFPSSDKKTPASAYKYPTYQHYYEPKVSELTVLSNPKPISAESAVSLQETFGSPTKKVSEISKDSSKPNNLKTELEHLKNQVHKIMEKKQGILRSPIDKRYNPPKSRQSETPLADDSDNQSVSSDKIFGEAKRKLQSKKSSENYDYSKYMELENNLLKTELRNLRNKYLNKKRELNQKCEGLQQKANFLQNALYKSQQSIANQVAALKQALRDAQQGQRDVPTSDKEGIEESISIAKEAEPQIKESELISEKIKSLYEELSLKTKIISEKQEIIEKIEGQLRKFKKESSLFQQKSSNLLRQLEQTQSQLEALSIKSEHSNIKLQKLQKINEQLTKIANNKAIEAVSKDAITDIQEEYNLKLVSLSEQNVVLSESLQRANEELMVLKEELKFYKSQVLEKQSKLETLTQKYQNQLGKIEQLETSYSRTLQLTQKRHEQLVKSLQNQIYSKVSSLTPQKKSKQRDQTPKNNEKRDGQSETLQNQLKRWKIQYKILKERYESYMKVEDTNKSQLKEYYRTYRESRQKIQVLNHKNQLLERQLEKYMKALTQKDAELLRKEVEIRKVANEAAQTISNNAQELITLKEQCKALENRLSEETQKNDKQVSYRKEIEEKAFNNALNEQGLKEVMERMKKRLLEQDEKISKNVKEIKNKETLIQKLKQELRELMENTQSQQSKKYIEKVATLVEQHLIQQQTAFIGLKSRLQEQQSFMQQQQKKSLDEIQQLKLSNYDLKRQMVNNNNQLRLISHSYNTKNMEMSSLLSERSRQIQELEQRLQQTEVMSMTMESALREEVNAKNEEITLLRREIISKFNITGGVSLNGTFDEVLRNQMEGNNKLKQQASKRAEEIYKLRDNYTTLRSQYENLKSQFDINKLKSLSQKKNMEVAFQVEVQNYRNIIDGWEKKVLSLQQKIKMIIQQNQKKDLFIKNFIIGKKITSNDKEILNDFMKKFEIAMESKDIVERLISDSKVIQNLQKYNENLLKEIATMKEKLFLFEAIDIEKISLYESKLSKRSHQSIQKESDQIGEIQTYSSGLKKTLSMQDMKPVESNIDESI